MRLRFAQKIRTLITAVLTLLITLAVTPLMAVGIMGIDWFSVGGRGGAATGGNYTLYEIIWQPVGGLSSSADPSLCSVFWCRVLEGYKIFLLMLLRN